ncbi:MAG TPA: isoleucine--tRNA ligase [Candidatus Nanoarchaeia archaeon]|nr:isoleucine--tRNA ligase [Candidatus Nanoarchaeia archaeon]
MSSFNPLEYEPQILRFWQENRIHKKANQKNIGKKPFYFCDGPPYTSGKVHIGTAWNKSLKDSILRYKRMQGFEVLDRAGYDMHGLPTENAAEKKLGIKNKDGIKSFGVGKFVMACKELAIENLRIMSQDFARLGVWMDFENAYQSVAPEFIDGEWWLVKKAHEKGRLYEGNRAMAWDWAHQTAVAKHELEYKDVKDTSIYVKMKVKGKQNEYLIIWTTTPWTIAFNLGIMAHPDVDYVRCKVEDEVWIVAKTLASSFIEKIANKKYTVIEEFKGEKLKGVEYEHPFHRELGEHYRQIKAKHPNTHTVVLTTEYVDTSAGTGLVHMAPGCGPEDYEVGHRNNIPAWNTVEESGLYGKGMGKFEGRHAIKENKSFIQDLDDEGALLAKATIEHPYPYGQRSHEPVIFRTTRQWFFRVEDMKERMIEENNAILWVPKAGYNAFNAWLENLRDNSISKQRYWGTPVPIWRNEKDPNDYLVIGSIAELETLSGQKVAEPHIPFIDEIVIKKDGKTYRRVPDVLDVWVDAGCASWNSLGFPKDIEAFKKYFPADFILEGKDQVRGWFNLLHIASMIANGAPSFKAAYMHGFVQDALGRKMSKSLGNYITPEEVVSKYGADTLRYYMTSSAAAGVDINYNFEDMKTKHKNLMVLWNISKFVLDLANQIGFNPQTEGNESVLDLEEKYILSRLHSTIMKVTKLYDEYRLDEAPGVVEALMLDLSRAYLQLTREKASGDEEEKRAVCKTAYDVLIGTLKLFAPTAPFITERIYLNLKEAFGLKEESIHLYPWPICDEALIDEGLEQRMQIVSQLIQSGLGAREKMGRGVKWPVREMIIVTEDDAMIRAAKDLAEVIKRQLNVKGISIKKELEGIRLAIKPNFSAINPQFKGDAAKVIAHLTMVSADSVLAKIEKEGRYPLKVNGESFDILKEHIAVSREVPKKYEEAQVRSSQLYLDREVDEELEGEGFAREAMRRVQSLRKASGLNKSQQIALHIQADEALCAMLHKWDEQIMEKVGALSSVISVESPKKDFQHSATEKVKGKEIRIFFDVVSGK